MSNGLLYLCTELSVTFLSLALCPSSVMHIFLIDAGVKMLLLLLLLADVLVSTVHLHRPTHVLLARSLHQ